ncbi:MAG: hypothetical protein RSC27_04605 [Bacilli bacterium]
MEFIVFLKQTPTSKGIFLQIVESYYDNGVSRQRVIEKIGYVEDLSSTLDNPITFYRNKAKQMTAEKLSSNEALSINMNATMDLDENSYHNVGYVILNEI